MVDTIKAYDAVAPIYAEYASKRKAYIQGVDSLVLSHLKSKSSLMDVGSGDGLRLREILSQSQIKSAIAVEPSSEMAKRCRVNANVEVIESTIDKLNHGQLYDVITALWNVLGHVPSELRIPSLQKMASSLTAQGIIMLDVNNRHNAPAYGHFKVLTRRLVDYFDFDEKRGDCYYDWQIGETKIPSYGHLFIHQEMLSLFQAASLNVQMCCAVNYENGVTSTSLTKGQLFYVLKKRI